jgi:hypothetical protein
VCSSDLALSLPILFAGGMTAMDTTDGVLMLKAYDWAFVNPLRKIFYNITITSLSIAVALIIGPNELLQVLIGMLDLKGPFFDLVAGLDFGILGYVIVATFLIDWGVSAAVWKFGRIEERLDTTALFIFMSIATVAGSATSTGISTKSLQSCATFQSWVHDNCAAFRVNGRVKNLRSRHEPGGRGNFVPAPAAG